MSKYKCPKCKSREIEANVSAWFYPNNGELMSEPVFEPDTSCECRDCGHTFKLADAEEKEGVA